MTQRTDVAESSASMQQRRTKPRTLSPGKNRRGAPWWGTTEIVKLRRGACRCIKDHIGDPYVWCRTECLINTECPNHLAYWLQPLDKLNKRTGNSLKPLLQLMSKRMKKQVRLVAVQYAGDVVSSWRSSNKIHTELVTIMFNLIHGPCYSFGTPVD